MTIVTKQDAPPTNTGALSKSSLDDRTDSFADAIAVSYILNTLSGSDLDHLIPLLKTRRENLKVLMTYEAAMDAYEHSPISSMAECSPFADSIRVRVACRILVSERRWHPDQIKNSMSVLAYEVCPHPLIATKAVETGILDGLAILKDRSENGN